MDRILSVQDRRVGRIASRVHWPDRRLSEVPPLKGARMLAIEVRQAAEAGAAECCPLCVEAVAALGGFTIVEGEMAQRPGGYRGLLQAVHGGFRICVDARPPRGGAMDTPTLRRRRRFVIAHEIGHSFFFDRRSGRPARLLPVGSSDEERFCNEFARALLLPPEVVRAAEPSPATAFRLSHEWDVSLQVVARALAEWHPASPFVAIGYWRPPSRRLQLQWAGGGDVAEPAGVAAKLLEREDGHFRFASLEGNLVSDSSRSQALAVATPA